MSESSAVVRENKVQSGRRELRVIAVAASGVLVLLNIAVITVYALWAQANDWAVNRSEAGHGFDSSMLLPQGHLFWIVANVSLFLLILFDGAWAWVCILVARAH